jgi:hypothetical protein
MLRVGNWALSVIDPRVERKRNPLVFKLPSPVFLVGLHRFPVNHGFNDPAMNMPAESSGASRENDIRNKFI